MEYKLIQVYEDLIPLLSNVASRIFIDYYKDMIGLDQATYMAEKFLSEDAIIQEVNNDTVFKLMYIDMVPVGFSEYKIDDQRLFLSKLYMHEKYRKKHLGRKLLDDAIEYGRLHKLNKLYLTVNKYNPTLKIYEHWGFNNIESVQTDIGNNYIMDDYIMELNI